jgi:gp32 DNA binding protein like
MAKLNIAELKKALNAQNGSKGPFWKPKNGESIIRIIPLASNPSNPFQELHFHYFENGRKTMLSPYTFGDPDPFVEMADKEIAAGGGNMSKDEFKEAMQLKPTKRFYVPVVVRGEEAQGVRFWGFGPGVYKDLLTIMVSDDYDDITDIESGHDIKVTFTPAPPPPAKGFAKTEIFIRPKPSPLTTDSELMAKLLRDQPVLLDEFTVSTYAELKEYMDKTYSATPSAAKPAAAASSDDDEWASAAPKATEDGLVKGNTDTDAKATKSTKATKASKPVADVVDEFADMFDE